MTKTALITGGTSGIGLGIALGFQAAGYRIVVTGVTEQEVQQTQEQHPGLDCRQLDVTSDSQVSQCLANLEELDVLINCAGVIPVSYTHLTLPTIYSV